jgi:hypothetical protein
MIWDHGRGEAKPAKDSLRVGELAALYTSRAIPAPRTLSSMPFWTSRPQAPEAETVAIDDVAATAEVGIRVVSVMAGVVEGVTKTVVLV